MGATLPHGVERGRELRGDSRWNTLRAANAALVRGMMLFTASFNRPLSTRSKTANISNAKITMSIQIVEADLSLAEHQEAVLAMVDAYSNDPMGNGKPLDQDVRTRLIPGLRRHPTTLIFLAFDGVQPIGTAVCFIGFSSFAAKPIINIHDFVVLPTSRGKGIGRRLLEAVEAKARELGCCKLTLEVMDKNHQAVRMYLAAGFERYSLQEEAGVAIFMSKPLQ